MEEGRKTAWLLAGAGAKKEDGQVVSPEDVFPELRNGEAATEGDGEGSGSEFDPEGERVLNMFMGMANVEKMRGERGDHTR